MSGTGGDDYRRSSSSAQASSSSTKIIKAIVRLPKTVISALSIEEVVTSCRRCRGPTPHYGDDFCSQPCALHYWERLRQENGKVSGTKINVIPCRVSLCGYVRDCTPSVDNRARGGVFSLPPSSMLIDQCIFPL